jgi:arylsulfatase A-like enzyme
VARIAPEPAHTAVAEAIDEADLPRAAGRSLVLLSIDALRADRLGAFGYERPVTPSLDAFAAASVAFTRAYAPSPTSSFSIPALHAGRPMEPLLLAGEPLPATLADRLGAAGYRTIGLYPAKIFSAGPELMGRLERSAFGFDTSVALTMEAEADARATRTALAAEAGRPVFLWVHFYDPHLPYECHGEPFGADPADCYDAEIRHVDRSIGRLLPWLVEQLDDPVVVITADHGEAFGEHGRLYHSADLYDEQIRVPLLLRVPGVEPRRIDAPVSIADIPATLLALAVGDAGRTCPGHDLRPLMIADAPASPVTASIRGRRAIIERTLKLMCSDWPGGPCALYDLAADPGETRNLIAERAADAGRMRAELDRIDRAQVEQMRGAVPRPIVLGRLGRADAAPELLVLAREPGSPHAVEAARALALLRRSELAESLATLHDSPDDEVAAWAAVGSTLLDESCPPEHLAPRARDRTDLGPWCAVALGRLRDPRGLKPLIANLRHDDPVLRAQSALALGELGDRRAVPPLLRLLQIKQSRWAAIESLGLLGDRRAAATLERLRSSDPDETNIPRYDRALLRILGP